MRSVNYGHLLEHRSVQSFIGWNREPNPERNELRYIHTILIHEYGRGHYWPFLPSSTTMANKRFDNVCVRTNIKRRQFRCNIHKHKYDV